VSAAELFNVDLNDLTIGEVVEIEERTGLPLDALGDPGKPKGKLLQTLAFIAKRREDPEFTWEQAGELKISTSADPVDPESGDE
tara:strand:- start:2577 stop:2828 length:252 start_codon:yes stop_codon:yes gene_type:complete